MKYNKFIPILLILIASFSSCKKDNSDEGDSNHKSKTLPQNVVGDYDDVFGLVSIMSHGRVEKNTRYYQISGHFSDMELGQGGGPKDAGDLTINSQGINKAPDYSYGSGNQTILQGLYSDATLNITLDGNAAIDIPAYSLSLDRPDDLVVNLIDFSKSNGVNLSWNASTDSGAIVSILLTDVDVNSKEFFKLVPDNGTYTITSADLAQFNIGERLEIIISRATLNGETVNINGQDKTFIANWITYQSETYSLQP